MVAYYTPLRHVAECGWLNVVLNGGMWLNVAVCRIKKKKNLLIMLIIDAPFKMLIKSETPLPPIGQAPFIPGIEHLLTLETFVHGKSGMVSLDVSNIQKTGPESDAIFPRIDLVCVADVSSSMSCTINGKEKGRSKINLLRDALSRMLDSLYLNYAQTDRIGLTVFDRKSKELVPLVLTDYTHSKTFFEASQSLKIGHGTNIMDGLNTALSSLANRTQKNKRCAIVLLSDGINSSNLPISDASIQIFHTAAKALDCSVFTLGIGSHHDPMLLQRLTFNGGIYAYLNDDFAMTQSISTVAKMLKCVAVQNCCLRVFIDQPHMLKSIEAGNYEIVKTSYGYDVHLDNVLFGETHVVTFDFYDNNIGFFAICDATIMANQMEGQVKSSEKPSPDTLGNIAKERGRFQIFSLIKQAITIADRAVARNLLHKGYALLDDLEKQGPSHIEFFNGLRTDLKACIDKIDKELCGHKTDLSAFARDIANANLNRRSITNNHSVSTTSFSISSTVEAIKKIWI